jgi:hypothetical protein
MWFFGRQVRDVLTGLSSNLKTYADATNTYVQDLRGRCTAKDTQLEHAWGAIADLRERLLLSEKRAARAETEAALWRVEINSLRADRAGLLARLVPGFETKVASIESPLQSLEAGMGISFEDMGDEAASAAGLDLHGIPPVRPRVPGVSTGLHEQPDSYVPDAPSPTKL